MSRFDVDGFLIRMVPWLIGLGFGFLALTVILAMIELLRSAK